MGSLPQLPSHREAIDKLKVDSSLPSVDGAATSEGTDPESVPVPKNTDASLINLSGNTYRYKLEQHIKDHNSGEGYKSANMYGDLFNKSTESNNFLAENDPTALKQYSGLLTAGFSYDNQARMVTALNNFTKTLGAITSFKA